MADGDTFTKIFTSTFTLNIICRVNSATVSSAFASSIPYTIFSTEIQALAFYT